MSPRVGRGRVRVGGHSLSSVSTPGPESPDWASKRETHPTSHCWGGGAESCQQGQLQSTPIYEAPRGTQEDQVGWHEEQPRPASEQRGPESLGLSSKRLLFLPVAWVLAPPLPPRN